MDISGTNIKHITMFDRQYTPEKQAEGLAISQAIVYGHCDKCGFLKRLELCRPCAEKLKEAYTVKPAGGIAKKITCQQCGKRRYGVIYQIEKK